MGFFAAAFFCFSRPVLTNKSSKEKKQKKGRSPQWAAATFSGKVSFHCLKLLATDLRRHEFTEEFQSFNLIPVVGKLGNGGQAVVVMRSL